MSTWHEVDRYINRELVKQDAALAGVLQANESADLPMIDVSPAHGKFLMLLAQICRARRVLEIGTLGGYSSIWLAKGLQPGGRVISLEAMPKHAEVARANIRRAGFADRIEVRLAPAVETLAMMVNEGAERFDMVFIDADKANNAKYVEWALMLTRSGSIIVIDNVVRGGAVLSEDGGDPSVVGTRAAIELISSDPRLDGTAIQTVGIKGWDGFAIARVV
ncbi:O-methyltransferase [Cryobacterium sp. BB736]|uniref:O-methyltransferase n=1 Tax=Cryobacterium sp. BB736 TaxID=2746963 RepID=UPI001874B0BD|nr:O-methyltransferase [Cryobacterium sp. BB736]